MIVRHITQQGLALIKKYEGFSSTMYLCPAGFETIGYGHVIQDDEKLLLDDGISRENAEELLRKDVSSAERAVIRLINVPLSDGQFDALVSFTFNLGSGALQRSTLRRKLNRHEYGDIPYELSRWVWSGGRKLNGLIRRRMAEGQLFSALP